MTARERLAGILGPDLLEALDSYIDERVVDAAKHSNGAGWLDRKAAAAYLSVPVSRLEKDNAVPCHRWDGRVLYSRMELDSFLLSQ